MARTKQTARKSTNGVPPRPLSSAAARMPAFGQTARPAVPAPPEDMITITVEDEWYFKKSFSVRHDLGLKDLFDHCLEHVCTHCSNTGMLEFRFNGVELRRNESLKDTGAVDGDIIDMNVKEICTRGPCPLARGQTGPNMHYLNAPVRPRPGRQLLPSFNVPPPPARDHVVFQLDTLNSDTSERVIRMRTDAPLGPAMQSLGLDGLDEGLWLFEEEVVGYRMTPYELGLYDGAVIEKSPVKLE